MVRNMRNVMLAVAAAVGSLALASQALERFAHQCSGYPRWSM